VGVLNQAKGDNMIIKRGVYFIDSFMGCRFVLAAIPEMNWYAVIIPDEVHHVNKEDAQEIITGSRAEYLGDCPDDVMLVMLAVPSFMDAADNMGISFKEFFTTLSEAEGMLLKTMKEAAVEYNITINFN
jgi:hypothetical protein